MKKLERGEKGYLKQRKTGLYLHLAILIVIAILIFIVGLLLNKGDKANIFTVAAVLMVLPAAKTFVLLVVYFPYHEMNADDRNFVEGLIKPGDTVFYDAVFTSSETKMHLDAIIVTGHQVIGYTGRKKDDISKIDRYFKNEFLKRQLSYVCYITDSKKSLENRIKMRSVSEELSEKQAAEKEEVVSLIRTQIV